MQHKNRTVSTITTPITLYSTASGNFVSLSWICETFHVSNGREWN